MSTIYVATNGKDSASGTTDAPLATIAAGLNKAKAGDEVVVRPGTYNSKTIWMKAGTSGKEIILRSETPRAAKIVVDDFAAIRMANYSIVDGFDVTAQGHGIFSEDVHHIKMLNNYVHDLGNTGIGGQRIDYVTVEGNECARCANDTWDSGISIYEPVVYGTSTEMYRIIIRGNICHDNFTQPQGGPHTDGNGIIIDDWNWTQKAGKRYPFGALVENNLCYDNGGKGIQVAWSDNCIVRNNTVMGNNKDSLNWGGDDLADLSSQDSHGTLFEKNLAIAVLSIRPSHKAIGYNYNSSNTTYSKNATWDGTVGSKSVMMHDAKDTGVWTDNIYGVDPKLVNWEPTNPLLSEIGWRSTGYVPGPIDEPDPLPEPEPKPIPDSVPETSPYAGLTPSSTITENQPYELGTKIKITDSGAITGLRMFRTNTTKQVITLWKNGEIVANSSISGDKNVWAEGVVNVPAVAGDEFVVSVQKKSTQTYPINTNELTSDVIADGYVILADGGVFSNTIGTLPTEVWNSSFYWVDIRFIKDVIEEPVEDDDEILERLELLETSVQTLSDKVDVLISAVDELKKFDQKLKDL